MELEIADRGPGLGDVDPRELFAAYRQGPAGESATEAGHGLGLAIVQQAVQAHRGAVHAANRDGGGAVFRITLPLEAAA